MLLKYLGQKIVAAASATLYAAENNATYSYIKAMGKTFILQLLFSLLKKIILQKEPATSL